MARVIGIRHQEKLTMAGEMRPTQFFIVEDDHKPVIIEFEEIVDELNWLVGRYATAFRKISDPTEDISAHAGYIKFAKPEEGEAIEGRHPSQVKVEKGKTKVAQKVPESYDGIRPDDIYLSIMGGSGHMLAAGLSAKLEKLGGPGRVYQIPPIVLANRFGKDRDKDLDPERLIELFKTEPNLFYEMFLRDRKIAEVKSKWSLRQAAQRARIAHGLRLRKIAIMESYANPETYAGALLEPQTLKYIAGDEEMEELEADESAATSALLKAVEATDVWQLLLSRVEGIGPAIAGGLIAAIVDIRRFHKPGQLAKYCGVGVVTHDKQGNKLEYATIQRRRSGEFSGWNNDARKCLWNFADQCNRRPESVWGVHLRNIKAKLQAEHPVPVQAIKNGKPAFSSNGKKPIMRYTPGHIHKFAIWRLQTDFIFWIWREWKRIHKYGAPKDFRPPGNRGTDIETSDIAEPAETVGV